MKDPRVMVGRFVRWRQRTTRHAARMAARAARLKAPKLIFKGQPIKARAAKLNRPAIRRRMFAITTWSAGIGLICWALFDLFGGVGLKLGAAVIALGAGGLVPLLRVLLNGLPEYPPWDWFASADHDENK